MRRSRRRPAWTKEKTVRFSYSCIAMRHVSALMHIACTHQQAFVWPMAQRRSCRCGLLGADNEDFLETLFTARRIGERLISFLLAAGPAIPFCTGTDHNCAK